MITAPIATWVGLGFVTLLCLIALYYFSNCSHDEHKPFKQ
jgi:hypothetical protein